jgi:hypothetical protein
MELSLIFMCSRALSIDHHLDKTAVNDTQVRAGADVLLFLQGQRSLLLLRVLSSIP